MPTNLLAASCVCDVRSEKAQSTGTAESRERHRRRRAKHVGAVVVNLRCAMLAIHAQHVFPRARVGETSPEGCEFLRIEIVWWPARRVLGWPPRWCCQRRKCEVSATKSIPDQVATSCEQSVQAIVHRSHAILVDRHVLRGDCVHLADAIGDLRSTLRARYGDKVLTPVIAPSSGMLSGLLGRRSPGAGAMSALDGIGGLPDELISALETRAIWAKFGF